MVNHFPFNLDQDLLEKRSAYIAKNNELTQEFFYAHPNTKIWINSVFNTSFYGSPLWNMSSRNFVKLEKSWNVSQYDVATKNCPSLSNRTTVKKRFISFIFKLRSSRTIMISDYRHGFIFLFLMIIHFVFISV